MNENLKDYEKIIPYTIKIPKALIDQGGNLYNRTFAYTNCEKFFLEGYKIYGKEFLYLINFLTFRSEATICDKQNKKFWPPIKDEIPTNLFTSNVEHALNMVIKRIFLSSPSFIFYYACLIFPEIKEKFSEKFKNVEENIFKNDELCYKSILAELNVFFSDESLTNYFKWNKYVFKDKEVRKGELEKQFNHFLSIISSRNKVVFKLNPNSSEFEGFEGEMTIFDFVDVKNYFKYFYKLFYANKYCDLLLRNFKYDVQRIAGNLIPADSVEGIFYKSELFSELMSYSTSRLVRESLEKHIKELEDAKKSSDGKLEDKFIDLYSLYLTNLLRSFLKHNYFPTLENFFNSKIVEIALL